MSQTINCAAHGESRKTFVCTHLLGETAGLGFHRDDPTDENPFPDAWCDNCELIRSSHNGGNDDSQALAKISLLCSGCYERALIRNTRTLVTLDDLADLRWKCGSCEEWHTGPCLDFSYDSPYYRLKKHEQASRLARLLPNWSKKRQDTFLDDNYCAIEGHDFFVRGALHLPIIGSTETLRWGVWASLGRENFETLLTMEDDRKRIELPPMFSWLSTQISDYPDTLNLKMYASINELDAVPHFELEPCEHPLAQEFHKGITAEHVKEIMIGRLRGNERDTSPG